MNGFISLLSYLFSFLIANFFGRFVLQSSIFSFLSSLKLNESVLNLNSFGKDRGDGIFRNFFNDPSNTFVNYLIFWVLIFVFFASFKRMFRKLFFITGFVKKIPIINYLDGLLGGIFGLIEALIFLIAFAFVCFIIILLTKNSLKFLNSDVIGSTKLFFMFYKLLTFIKFNNFV